MLEPVKYFCPGRGSRRPHSRDATSQQKIAHFYQPHRSPRLTAVPTPAKALLRLAPRRGAADKNRQGSAREGGARGQAGPQRQRRQRQRRRRRRLRPRASRGARAAQPSRCRPNLTPSMASSVTPGSFGQPAGRGLRRQGPRASCSWRVFRAPLSRNPIMLGGQSDSITNQSSPIPVIPPADNKMRENRSIACRGSPEWKERHQKSTQSTALRPERSVYFGFITMERPKCLLDARGWKSVRYCGFVCVLLFLVGFIVVLLFSVVGVIPIVHSQLMGIGITCSPTGDM